MAHTPKEVKVKVNLDNPVIKGAIKDAEEMGFEMGLEKGRREILDFLQHAYLDDPGRPDRGSPRAEALLEVADAASRHFQKKLKKKGRKS